MVFFHEVKGLFVFSAIRLKGEINFFIGKFLEVLYFPCHFVVKAENF